MAGATLKCRHLPRDRRVGLPRLAKLQKLDKAITENQPLAARAACDWSEKMKLRGRELSNFQFPVQVTITKTVFGFT